jgi:hypothetical protein
MQDELKNPTTEATPAPAPDWGAQDVPNHHGEAPVDDTSSDITSVFDGETIDLTGVSTRPPLLPDNSIAMIDIEKAEIAIAKTTGNKMLVVSYSFIDVTDDCGRFHEKLPGTWRLSIQETPRYSRNEILRRLKLFTNAVFKDPNIVLDKSTLPNCAGRRTKVKVRLNPAKGGYEESNQIDSFLG